MPTSTTSSAGADRPNTTVAARCRKGLHFKCDPSGLLQVDQALAVLEQHGTRAAADFLQARGAGRPAPRRLTSLEQNHPTVGRPVKQYLGRCATHDGIAVMAEFLNRAQC
jgi:hypothetical protein